MGLGELPQSIARAGASTEQIPGVPFATPTANVARFLPAMADRQPDAIALRVPVGRRNGAISYHGLTFAGLDAACDAWAHRAVGAGIRRGTRVLVLVRPGLPLIALCFALFKIGAVPVVIDPGMGWRSFLRCVRRTAPEALAAIPAGRWMARLFPGAFRSVRARLAVPAAPPPAGVSTMSRQGASFPVAPTRRDELAAIVFTSGSTGAPKGVRYEHGMFEAQVEMIRAAYAIEPGEVDLPMLPVFALFNPALGVTTVVPEMDPGRPAAFDPARVVQAIQQCRVTTSFGAPVLWRRVADHCLARGITLPTLRRVLMAGAPVPPSLMADLRRVLPRARLHSPYGATEALPVASIADDDVLATTGALTLRGRGTCVGRVLPGIAARIIRVRDDVVEKWNPGLELPPGEPGEIVVRGPIVTQAYDGLPEATRRASIADGGARAWHRMGDIGYLDTEGRLWFCGRKAERVPGPDGLLYTECCEPVFNQHPRVARTALISWEGGGKPEPALVIEPRPGAWPRTTAERARLAAELRALGATTPATRGISAFFFHRHFPVDVRHNAKIHRLALARHFRRRKPLRVP